MKPIRTTFATDINPFTGVNMKFIDPATLKISTDPLPAGKAKRDKYADLWARLKPGQCVVCESEHVGRIAGAMKKHVADKGLDCHVRLTTRYTDGKGRVWLLANEKKRALKVA